MKILKFIFVILSFQLILTNCNTMSKKKIYTNQAPSPIGPYSQAIEYGNLIFISGQVAINPATGGMENTTLEQEVRMVMQNIGAILQSQNLTYSNILKSTIFIKDMNDFAKINEIYAEYFEDTIPPARETVEVSRLPKDARIEISVIVGK